MEVKERYKEVGNGGIGRMSDDGRGERKQHRNRIKGRRNNVGEK